jgi:hypothetical protein
MVKRYEQLNLTRTPPKTLKLLDEEVDKCASELAGAGASESKFHFLYMRVGILSAIAHLGVPGLKRPIEEYSKIARELFVDYLYRDWWKGTKHEVLNMEAVNKDPKFKRTADSNVLTWFYSGRIAALHAAIFEDVMTLQRIADWVEPWMVPEPKPLGVDPLVGKAFLFMLNDFRQKGPFDTSDLERELKASRKKGPKLLFNLWHAVQEKNQSDFNKVAIESVRQFEKTMPSELIAESDQVDIDTSLFVAAGRLKGMALPELPEDVSLRLVTQESVSGSQVASKRR